VKNWVGAVVIAGLSAACGGGTPQTTGAPEATGTPGTSTAEQGQPAGATVPSAERPPTPGGQTAERPQAAAKPEPPPPPPAPTHREVTLPEGTALRLELKSAVASDSSSVEDAVTAVLRQPVVVDGQTVLPAGTTFAGTVTDVERSGRVKGVARVAYRFNSFTYDDERHSVATAPLVHEAEATKKEDAKKIAIGAGIGAAIGAIAGGGDGAAKGAAIGGAGGTGVVLGTRGNEVRLGPGADVTTRLTAPVTVRVKL
jgi:hypothetical protein